MTYMIRTFGLVKRYGKDVVALNGLDLPHAKVNLSSYSVSA